MARDTLDNQRVQQGRHHGSLIACQTDRVSTANLQRRGDHTADVNVSADVPALSTTTSLYAHSRAVSKRNTTGVKGGRVRIWPRSLIQLVMPNSTGRACTVQIGNTSRARVAVLRDNLHRRSSGSNPSPTLL